MNSGTIEIKGNTRDIKYKVDDKGCWIPTSHKARPQDKRARLIINGKKEYMYRYVYTLFKGNIGSGLLVRHMCNNPSCINPNHLETGTHDDNMNDAAIAGSHKGEKNNMAKLSDKDVSEIKYLLAYTTFSFKEISKMYNCSTATLGAIYNKQNWSWILPELNFKERFRLTKYTPETILSIDEDIKNGMTYHQIKDKHRVSMGLISDVKHRHKYKDILEK